jgi:Na+/H+ antiporter
MLTMLSKRWKVSYPILLVIAGLLISLIPGLPPVRLQSEIVFLIFLPPLLFFAAWNTSWKSFWEERRRISMLAFGLVIITSGGIAVLCHYMIPNFSLATGFLLGAIISPPDAVATSSILEGKHISKKVVMILEGESLVNDASSLIVFRFAMMAILTGGFSLGAAYREFFMVTGGGIVVGLMMAGLVYLIHRFMPTTPDIDTTMTLLAPYIMYMSAEHFRFSGVMAVVSGGLFLSARSHEVFNYGSRLQVSVVWKTINFLLNGLVFILIGLQMKSVMHGLQIFSLSRALFYSAVISVVTILIRILWVWPLSYWRFLLSKKRKPGDIFPARSTFIVAWSGMRGVVSLASALSIPLVLTDGNAFPFRDLILFITFSVIFVTLVIQGLSLPFIIRILHVPGDPVEAMQKMEVDVQIRLASAALDFLNGSTAESEAETDLVIRLKRKYADMLNLAEDQHQAAVLDEDKIKILNRYHDVLNDLIQIRRKELTKLRKEKRTSDEIINKRERELDLEEATLQSSILQK